LKTTVSFALFRDVIPAFAFLPKARLITAFLPPGRLYAVSCVHPAFGRGCVPGQLPSYKVDSSFDTNADGDVVLSLNVTQSNVDERFRMLVPIYLELADGNMFFLGRARMIGNTSIEQKVPIKGLKTKPRRAVLNYFDDVLASAN
jgi:hypothetical protein